MKKIIILIVLTVLFGQLSFAQRRKSSRKSATQTTPATREAFAADTSRPRTVTVTSAFKPTLRAPAKINFSAASPAPDSIRPSLQYDVPAQNLFFSYQPAALNPLAADIDTSINWENKNYVKAGYGNYSTPYLEAGLSLGNGLNSVINTHFKHTSSKGTLPFQQFSKTGLDIIGVFNQNENTEWSGKLFFDNNSQFLYGYQPDSLKFAKEDLRQRFTTFGGRVNVRNRKINRYGISYSPNLAINAFTDNRGGNESTLVLNAPVSKSFGKIFAFNLGLTADLTNYKSDVADVKNNLYVLSPAIQFKTPDVKVILGINPSWDNSVFTMLPNFSAEAKLKEEKFILQAGWIGYFNKTTYKSLADFNPWLQQPKFLLNTRIKEQYAGFRGSAGSHVTYNAKVSFLQFSNQPLFVNDTITGRSFEVINEPSMKAIRLHGEIGYTMAEKFSLLAGATINQYSNLEINDKAWGLLPIELNGTLRWNIFKDVLLKSDLYFWDGPRYRTKGQDAYKLKPALDLNAGVEFSILPKINFWIQCNNILNNRYQRWNQYEVLGFNVVGGIVYSFSQNKQ